jgi:hypothetical protein
VEVVPQTNEVSFGVHLREAATEDIAIEFANVVSDPVAEREPTNDFQR